MRLNQQEDQQEQQPTVFPRTPEEIRFDTQTAQKAILLAGQLQHQHTDTMTQAQVETIAEEVGVDPAFVRKALGLMEQEQQSEQQSQESKQSKQSQEQRKQALQNNLKETQVAALQTTQSLWAKIQNINPKMWWAIAWIMIPASGILQGTFRNNDIPLAAIAPFVYVGLGLYLSMRNKEKGRSEENNPKELSGANAPVSRQELLNTLFTLQKQLESEKQHCAFLSLDVVHSSEMKKNNPALAVEFSFDQYQNWVEAIVTSEGGRMQIAAGDGAMCLFKDDKSAVRTAQRLLTELPRFNREHNHLNQPFQIRCGINAGEVALDPTKALGKLQSQVIDRAALLQKKRSLQHPSSSVARSVPRL